MNDTRNKKDKNQHIQVFVRVRPINSAEKTSKSPVVVDVPSNKEVVVRERPQDKLTKKFTFDKVFGPVSKQIDVYNAVVSPLLEEVLAGYNCTVFAYGQTGTGKTFTMEGSCNDPGIHWQADSMAGIIPRALSHLFDELRTLGAQEYSVRVSFLELYNEELFDLLSPNDDASKIRIYEDTARKGAIIIHGLEEVTVHNKSEVYKILEKGSEKRQTAATLMNAHSSRSHTVFSITVHIKENTVDGEELLKTGKLNLVDLAGSENVGRSGAVDRRAREAGNINQSLLTLGRVITALVERAPHIPYRESKLTRLLQESLGGRTKTSIIATISPANMNIEETLSTLDYAHRAKNITNRPEINQKLSKKAVLKEYTEEIERLRRDLAATRERNGVYLAQENYNEMQSLLEVQSKEIEEKINHIKVLEENMRDKEKLFDDLRIEFESTSNELFQTKEKFESTKNDLITTKHRLHETVFDRDLQKHLVQKHVSTEKTLITQAKTLLNVVETATDDTHKLHDKINRKEKVEEANENLSKQFLEEMSQRFQHVEENFGNYSQELTNFCASLQEQVNAAATREEEAVASTTRHISEELVRREVAISEKLVRATNDCHDEYQSWILNELAVSSDMSERERAALEATSLRISAKVRQLVENGIAESLKELHKRSSLQLAELKSGYKRAADRLCDSLIADRTSLTKQIEAVKKSVAVAVENQNKIAESEESFSKDFEDLKRQFETVCKKYECKRGADKKCHSVIANKLTEVHEKSIYINNDNLTNTERKIKQERAFEAEAEESIDVVQRELSTGLEKNWNIAENTVVQSANVISQLEDDLNVSRHSLLDYKKLVDDNAKKLKDKIGRDKEATLSSVQEYHEAISDASAAHTRFMREHLTAMQTSYGKINGELENEVVQSREWKDNIISQLHSTREKMENFVVKELHRDVATGQTPVRRDFSYPRNLVATSPHERIVQRFYETRQAVESSEDENNSTLTDMMSLTDRNSDSTLISTPRRTKSNCVKSSTPYSESKIRLPAIYTNNNTGLTKSASTSNLHLGAKVKLEMTAMSESDMLKHPDNKENGEEEFIKPVLLRPKGSIKSKISTRKILGISSQEN